MKTSEWRKARRGSVGTRRVTPCVPVRTFWMRKSLELRRCFVCVSSLLESAQGIDEQHEGKGCREVILATGKGKPLKAESQGRYPHEIGRDRLWVEQCVKRLRKSEGAAQPSQVSSVLVATCFLKRRRVWNSMEGRSLQCASLAIVHCSGQLAQVVL